MQRCFSLKMQQGRNTKCEKLLSLSAVRNNSTLDTVSNLDYTETLRQRVPVIRYC